MRILVTGSGGFVGRHLLPQLSKSGNQVVRLLRGDAESRADAFCGPAELADIGAWRSWPDNIDVVVHLAALNPARGEQDIAELRRANVDGTAALAKRARREGVKRIIFLSSANVYSAASDGIISENSPRAPNSAYAISKKEAEDSFWAALAGGNTEGCVLRPAPVYGTGGRGNFASLIKLARLPLPLPLDGIGGLRSVLAIGSLVEAIKLSTEAPSVNASSFNVADDGPLSMADIIRALRLGWGKPPMILPAPAQILSRMAAVAGKGEAWRNLTRSFVLDTSQIQNVLGWRSAGTSADKIRAMAASGQL